MTTPRPATDSDNPAVVYRDSLAPGSYWAVHHSLVTIAGLLGGERTDPWSYPWSELAYSDTTQARRRFALATVNKILTSLSEPTLSLSPAHLGASWLQPFPIRASE